MTNEYIHASVNFQPPSQLRPTVSALFSDPGMFTSLSRLEKELQTNWPNPGIELNEKQSKKKKGKNSLSDEEGDTASIASSATTLRPNSTPTALPNPSSTSSSLVDEKSLSDEEKESSHPPPSTPARAIASHSPSPPDIEDDDDDDYFSPMYWRETSDRLTPNEYPPERWSPFKAAQRKMRKIGDELGAWEERREEKREMKEILREKKKERRK